MFRVLRLGGCALRAQSRLRHKFRVWARFALVGSWLMAGVVPAAAQSFLQSLFGLGQPSQAAAERVSRPQPMQSAREDRPVRERSRSHAGDGDSGGKFQTMCVRACDGYYWPLRYPSLRSEFKQDEASCQATCGAETRLYYRSGPGVDAEEMTDTGGQSYGASPTAFAYRKGLVNGCTCRPMPWSDGERARHEGYLLAEQETALRLAQAETEKAAAGAEAEAAKARQNSDEVPVAAADIIGWPPVGPAEAAVIAAVPPAVQDEGEPVVEKRIASAEAVSSARARRMAKEARAAGAVKVVAAVPAKPAKAAQVAWFGGGGGKFTYPGDPPGR